MRISKKAILEGLRALYPDAGPELHFRNPYETLVAVMLSAQCTDKQVNKVTPKLFAQWPTPEAMAGASVADVADTIKSLGFYKSKAKHAVEAAQMIVADYGGEVPADMKELVKLPGEHHREQEHHPQRSPVSVRDQWYPSGNPCGNFQRSEHRGYGSGGRGHCHGHQGWRGTGSRSQSHHSEINRQISSDLKTADGKRAFRLFSYA